MKLTIAQLLEDSLNSHKAQKHCKGSFEVHTMTNKKAGAVCSDCQDNIGVNL